MYAYEPYSYKEGVHMMCGMYVYEPCSYKACVLICDVCVLMGMYAYEPYAEKEGVHMVCVCL